jgi:hypothetical protein
VPKTVAEISSILQGDTRMSSTRVSTLTLKKAENIVHNLLLDFNLDSREVNLPEAERLLKVLQTLRTFAELEILRDLLVLSILNKKSSNKELSVALIHPK